MSHGERLVVAQSHDVGPKMNSLNSPSRNLLGSGMEIVALNCLVVEKTAFLCTRCCVPGTCMRQTNRRTKKQTNKQSSLDKCRCHDVFTGNQFTRTSRCHDRYGQFGL